MARSGTEQRAHLVRKQKGRCHYCKCRMRNDWKNFTWVDDQGHRRIRKGVKIPPNMATIEHLDSRMNPERGKAPLGKRRRVAACYECNQLRGQLDKWMDDFKRRVLDS